MTEATQSVTNLDKLPAERRVLALADAEVCRHGAVIKHAFLFGFFVVHLHFCSQATIRDWWKVKQ